MEFSGKKNAIFILTLKFRAVRRFQEIFGFLYFHCEHQPMNLKT